jgi:N-formylglutamate deformylase
MQEQSFDFTQGHIPLVISIPHMGTQVPPPLQSSMTAAAATLVDTDWHLDQLYSFAREMGASVIHACYSRYVIDLNRPPDGQSLYPGQTTTDLCPTETFRGERLYKDGCAPDQVEIERRRTCYWQPYHTRLEAELQRLRDMHGKVLLWDAHSIASQLPRLFEGKLPDFNLGTNLGRSAAPALIDALESATRQACGETYSWVLDGRFKGGYITRHYGRPQQQMHALQLEMCQSVYMDETAPFAYRPDLAATAIPVVRNMLEAVMRALAI